nr:hypothetical protein CparaKRNrm1_p043 [Cryptomonas paramecium]
MKNLIFFLEICLEKYLASNFFTPLCNFHLFYFFFEQFKFMSYVNGHTKTLCYFVLFSKINEIKNGLTETFINKLIFLKFHFLNCFDIKKTFFFFLNYTTNHTLHFRKKLTVGLFHYTYSGGWIFNFSKKTKNSNINSKNFKISYFLFCRNYFFLKSNGKNFQLSTKKNLCNNLIRMVYTKQTYERGLYVIFSLEYVVFFLLNLNIFFGMILKLFFLSSYSFKISLSIVMLCIKNLFFLKKKTFDITSALLHTFFLYKKELKFDKFVYTGICIIFLFFFSKHLFYSPKLYFCFLVSINFFLNFIYITDKTIYLIDNILIYSRLFKFPKKKKTNIQLYKMSFKYIFFFCRKKKFDI